MIERLNILKSRNSYCTFEQIWYRHLNKSGFTLVELLVSVAIIALVASLALPALSRAKEKGRQAVCISNKRQLAVASSVYSNDYGEFVFNSVPIMPPAKNWIIGIMLWTTDYRVTNVADMIDPRYALLPAYFNNVIRTVKCPSDNYLSDEQRQAGWLSRPRTVTMNWFVGRGDGDKAPNSGGRKLYRRESDFVRKSPSQIFVFLDDHPDYIRFGVFIPPAQKEHLSIALIPGSLHHGQGTLSFADGHVASKKWLALSTRQPVKCQPGPVVRHPDLRDALWLREHGSEPHPEDVRLD